jgi:hypothetical protein
MSPPDPVPQPYDQGEQAPSLSALRREARTIYGGDPAGYEAGRPDYPDELYDILGSRCGLRPGASVVEIGAGTGLVTRRLVAAGARVTAVEPDEHMALRRPRAPGRVPRRARGGIRLRRPWRPAQCPVPAGRRVPPPRPGGTGQARRGERGLHPLDRGAGRRAVAGAVRLDDQDPQAARSRSAAHPGPGLPARREPLRRPGAAALRHRALHRPQTTVITAATRRATAARASPRRPRPLPWRPPR